jgi:DNA processing protein
VVDALTRPGGADREEIVALLMLDRAAGVGLVGLRALVDHFGSASDALRRSPAACRRICRGFEAPGPDARRSVEEALTVAERLGMSIVTWRCPGYPEALGNLHDPPPLLFLRGRAELLSRRSLTVVGARRATARSRDVAERLGGALAGAGVCVVSGMALGIDGAVHRGALSAGGDTVAVLGRGADAPYPPSHHWLFRDIVERGLVVSEFAPGTPPLTHHFPRRNRILAALSEAVVVVEAGARSGSLITVDHALDLGLDVWSVPGPIDLAACRGSNRLLAEGAKPLLDVAGFVEHVAGGAAPAPARLEGPAGEILAAVAEAPLSVDDLSAGLGLPAPDVLRLLTELELLGAVRRMPGMRFGVAA